MLATGRPDVTPPVLRSLSTKPRKDAVVPRSVTKKRRVLTAVAGAALLASSAAIPASAADGTVGGAGPIKEYAPFPTPVSYPCEVIVDDNGKLWTDQFIGNRYGRVDPETGQVSETPLPNLAGLPGGQNKGPDGSIWFVEATGNALGRLNPETLHIDTYPFPWGNIGPINLPATPTINTGLGVPFDNSFGKDGKLYFALIGLNIFGSYDPATGQWERYDIPTPLSGPIAMEKGPANTIAFTEAIGNKIALFDIYTHEFTEYTIPTPGAFPGGLTVSPDDKYLYFGETLTNKIGRIEYATGKIEEFDLLALRKGLPSNLLTGNPLPNPGQMRFGSDGKLYIMQGTFTLGNQVGQFDPKTLEYNELRTPTPYSSPCDLNNTVPGKIFFAEFTGNRIAYFDIPVTEDISNTFPVFG
ncbi:hypothetical protein AMETH_3190 [Amycolatopsis methanolica 239]|uniref:Virginiamycin B lyase n=1 Tax=Amycolatopsis methanolica 239 TaxID=1068978 RepID=A0A076N0E9_AMYME|nr:hypothetical protein AMETH_3190 [Amycolatopsis methanolica 239]